mmetsp:Transcript_44722/g.103418  ORF Transcript_44722/g.103418 Transcript_44722/m.103418 type:complete len:381 (+) Transcript_44722:69-1211(+)
MADCAAEEEYYASTAGEDSKHGLCTSSEPASLDDASVADVCQASSIVATPRGSEGGYNTPEVPVPMPMPYGWMPQNGQWNNQCFFWRSANGDQRGTGRGSQKRRFCTSFPDIGSCRRGSTCAFAHSRDEIRAPLLTVEEEMQDPQAMTEHFFMYRYKTMWCPIGIQHEWHSCVYAHNYQDARRPISIGYGPRLCPYWNKKDTCTEYAQRCPVGLRCPYAHGAKEQLYHPMYFKTVTCRDLKSKACPRHHLCAFFHNKSERRCPPADDMVDYSLPLPEEDLPIDWVQDFLSPPFAGEANKMERFNDTGAVMPYTQQALEQPHQWANQVAQPAYDIPQAHGQFPGQQGMYFVVPMGGGMNGMMCPQAPMAAQGNWVMMPVAN